MSATQEVNRFMTTASWQEYGKFLEAVGDRPVRVTYDQGSLEIMSPSPEHERVKSWLRALAEGVLTARGLDYIPGGSTTFRREDLQRGLEPDECYWIANFEAVRHTPEVDLDRDPPPDLVLEIDISRSSINRLEVYRSMGVPEVWLYRKTGIEVHLLQGDGTYAISASSAIFTDIPMVEFTRHLEIARQTSISRAVRALCSTVGGS